MKLYCFKKGEEITGWAFGASSHFETKDCECIIVELSAEGEEKLTKRTHRPVWQDGRVILVERSEVQEEDTRRTLKEKFARGEITNEDVAKAIALLL